MGKPDAAAAAASLRAPWLLFWKWWERYQLTSELDAPDDVVHVPATPEEDKEADPGPG